MRHLHSRNRYSCTSINIQEILLPSRPSLPLHVHVYAALQDQCDTNSGTVTLLPGNSFSVAFERGVLYLTGKSVRSKMLHMLLMITTKLVYTKLKSETVETNVKK